MIYDLINKVFSSTIPFESIRIAAAARKLGVATFFRPLLFCTPRRSLPINTEKLFLFIATNCEAVANLFLYFLPSPSSLPPRAKKTTTNCFVVPFLSYLFINSSSARFESTKHHPKTRKAKKILFSTFCCFVCLGKSNCAD